MNIYMFLHISSAHKLDTVYYKDYLKDYYKDQNSHSSGSIQISFMINVLVGGWEFAYLIYGGRQLTDGTGQCL